MKTELGIDDGRRAGRLASYLEKSGEVRRVKNGQTYEFYLAGFEMPKAAEETIYTEPDKPESARAIRPRNWTNRAHIH